MFTQKKLLDAARKGDIVLLEACLTAHPEWIAYRDETGNTALLWAAWNGHTETVACLLKHGASLTEKNTYGTTALLLAAFNSKTETVEWLLDHGSSLTEKNKVGNTALLLAAKKDKYETIEWLVYHYWPVLSYEEMKKAMSFPSRPFGDPEQGGADASPKGARVGAIAGRSGGKGEEPQAFGADRHGRGVGCL